jgi:translation elongation factor EF-4
MSLFHLPQYGIPMEMTRNFALIAHIDHGKSTLADRRMEISGQLKERAIKYLARIDLESQKGITIMDQTVRIPYIAGDGTSYILNLIDTQGQDREARSPLELPGIQFIEKIKEIYIRASINSLSGYVRAILG